MALRAKWMPQNLVFFALCFVYLWLAVEPRLIYFGFGTLLPSAPPFATGRAFLMDALAMPGGGIAYVSGLLSQGFYFSWLGAAIIVLTALGLSELCRRHLSIAGLRRSAALTGLPAVALFLIYSRYKHPLPICLAVSLGLALSLLFEKVPSRRPPLRVAAYCLMAALGFWIGGFGTLLMFAILTVIHASLPRRDWATALLVPFVSIAVVWALAEYLFLIAPQEAFLILTPFAPSMGAGSNSVLRTMVFLLYGLAPLIVLLATIWTKVVCRAQDSPKTVSKKQKQSPKKVASPSFVILQRLIPSALLIVMAALSLYVSHDELAKPYVLSNYYWHQRQWDKILELGRRLPKAKSNVFVNHDILRALYHTGRLPYDMFRFPLNPHALLLTHEHRTSDLALCKLSDIFLELGHVNMAQKSASELLATKAHLAIALETLGWISIIRDQGDTARIYLNALEKDLVYRTRAQSLLHGLDSVFSPEQSARITRIRSSIKGDPMAVCGSEPLEQTLAALLKQNPGNRMAFEYLMACYLVTGKVNQIVENMDRLSDLGYQEIPTLYEEAILIYYGSQRRTPDLDRFKIRSETIQRYQRFVQVRGAMQPQNRQAVLNTLIREFGTSYFFYFSFGSVGLV